MHLNLYLSVFLRKKLKPFLRKPCLFKIGQNEIKITGKPLLFKKMYMTNIKVLIVGINFYLKKNCLSRKMYNGVQNILISEIFGTSGVTAIMP